MMLPLQGGCPELPRQLDADGDRSAFHMQSGPFSRWIFFLFSPDVSCSFICVDSYWSPWRGKVREVGAAAGRSAAMHRIIVSCFQARRTLFHTSLHVSPRSMMQVR
jgi:hypothetical protein